MLLMRPRRQFALYIPVLYLVVSLGFFALGVATFSWPELRWKDVAAVLLTALLCLGMVSEIRTVRVRGSAIVVRSLFRTRRFEQRRSTFGTDRSVGRGGVVSYTLFITDGEQKTDVGEIPWSVPSEVEARFTKTFIGQTDANKPLGPPPVEPR